MHTRSLVAKMALIATLATGLTGCGVIYTTPSVSERDSTFGGATDLDVNIVPLTFESTIAANLDPYIPARLPLGFQEAAVSTAVARAGGQQSLGPLPAPSSPAVSRPGAIVDRLPPNETQRPYTIGVADVLLLSVNSSGASLDALPSLISAQSKRQGFVVQDDGAIAIPDVGRTQVSGLTMQEAESAIFQALVVAGVDPSFSLEVAEFNSQRVSVGGLVRAPQLVPVTLKPLRLYEAISASGGLALEDPSVSKVQIFRDGQSYQISAETFLSNPNVRNLILRDGDSVYVGAEFREDVARSRFEQQIQLRTAQQQSANLTLQQANIASQNQRNEIDRLEAERDLFLDRVELGAVKRDYAYLAGEVQRPQRVELPFENRLVLSDVLFNDRGININFGDYSEIYVLRRSGDPAMAAAVSAYHLDAENAVNLALASSFEIHAGDVVFVAEQPVTSWNRALTQVFPSFFGSALNSISTF